MSQELFIENGSNFLKSFVVQKYVEMANEKCALKI